MPKYKCPSCHGALERKEEYSKKLNQNIYNLYCPRCKVKYQPKIEIEEYDPGRCPNCGSIRLAYFIDEESNEEYEMCEDCKYILSTEDTEFPSSSTVKMSYGGLGIAIIGFGLYAIGTGLSLTGDTSDLQTYVENARIFSAMGLLGIIFFMLGTIIQFLSLPKSHK